MDIEFLKNLLPDVEEDTLNALLSTHQQELSTLTTANAQLSQDLSAARYDIALEQATAPLHFSSRAAKSAFLSAARAKNLPIEEGKLQGFGEFRRQFEENDPGAFCRGPVVVKDTGGGTMNCGNSSALRRAFGLK